MWLRQRYINKWDDFKKIALINNAELVKNNSFFNIMMYLNGNYGTPRKIRKGFYFDDKPKRQNTEFCKLFIE